MSSRFLYFQVHGVKPPRVPRRRSSGRGPARSWKYRAWIRSLPCAVCGTTRHVEAAHTGSDGGTAQKASDYSCVPLCQNHHTLDPDSYHVLGRDEFAKRHGLDLHDLVRRLNHDWFAYRSLVK